jgi:hypothetical protein
VGETDTLWLMFDGPTIDNSLLELILDRSVDRVTLGASQQTMIATEEIGGGTKSSTVQALDLSTTGAV